MIICSQLSMYLHKIKIHLNFSRNLHSLTCYKRFAFVPMSWLLMYFSIYELCFYYFQRAHSRTVRVVRRSIPLQRCRVSMRWSLTRRAQKTPPRNPEVQNSSRHKGTHQSRSLQCGLRGSTETAPDPAS